VTNVRHFVIVAFWQFGGGPALSDVVRVCTVRDQISKKIINP